MNSKEFDIWSVKFNGDIALESCDELSVTFTDLEHTMCLGRTEIIAAAKHLNVTAEELKWIYSNASTAYKHQSG